MKKLFPIIIILMSLLSVGVLAQTDLLSAFPTDAIPMDAIGEYLPMLMTFLAAYVIIVISLISVLYIYNALTLMLIAQKTETSHAWMAWFPILNFVLRVKVSGLHWAHFFVFSILIMIPPIGLVYNLWLWWKTCEKRGFSGFLSFLSLLPIANLILRGILAWGKGNALSPMPKVNPVAQPITKKEEKQVTIPEHAVEDPQMAKGRAYVAAAMATGKTKAQIKVDLEKAGWPDWIIAKIL